MCKFEKNVLDRNLFNQLLKSTYNKHNKVFDKFQEECWWYSLRMHIFNNVKAAFYKHYTQCSFMPTEKEILDILRANVKPEKNKTWSSDKESQLSMLREQYTAALSSGNIALMRKLASKESTLTMHKMAAYG